MNQDSAILHLLEDDDPVTVALVKTKLAEVKSLEALRELRDRAAGAAALHLDALVLDASVRHAEAAFTAKCETLTDNGDLEEANWLLAATYTPGQDFHAQRLLLDEWGQELRGRLVGVVAAGAKVDVAVQYLSQELRLRGNEAEYYLTENSLLPRVIERRLGIPISLSLVYMLVGKRAHLEIEGVGLPGHFLARHEEIFFDPFHGGRRVGLEECAALLEQQNLSLTPQHLRPATPRQMLLRTLTNLYYIAEQKDPGHAAKLSRWADLLK